MQITIHLNSGKNINGLNLKKEEVESLFSRDVTVINTDKLKFFVPKQNINFVMAEKEEEKKNVD